MNKNVKNITLLGLLIMLVFTIFSLAKIRSMQHESSDEMRILQSGDSTDEALVHDGKIWLRLANNQGPSHPASRACDYFAELVKERTNGRIEILNYHSGQLGDEKSVISQVMYGGIDLARVSIALLAEYESELIVLQMPYLYESAEHMWKVLDSEIGDRYLKSLRGAGLEGLCWYDAGARNFYTTEKKIYSAQDLHGLKIRVLESSFLSDVLQSLGAEPIEIPYHKVEMALKYNEIDGAENNFSSFIGMGHHLYAKNIVLDEHVRIPEMIIINEKVLGQLSEEDQKILYQAARESSVWQRELWKEQDEENIKTLERAGVTITKVKDKQGFIDQVQPIYDTYGKGYEALFEQIREMKEE